MPKPPQIKPVGRSTPYIKMCVIAGSGFGKTIFSATAPKALHLVTDKEGTESVLGAPPEAKVNLTNEEWAIDHIDRGENSLVEAYNYLLNGGCDEYEWLIHDTVSAENGLAMDRAMEIMRARKGKQDPFVPDKPQYLRSQQQFWDMFNEFHALPINQIWLAWPRKMILTDPETEEEEEVWTAAIQNDFVAEKFLGQMKITGFGHTFKKKGTEDSKAPEYVRRMYFSQRGMYRGKDRYNALGNFKDNLTVPRMMDLIEAKRSGRTVARTARKTAATRRRRTA